MQVVAGNPAFVGWRSRQARRRRSSALSPRGRGFTQFADKGEESSVYEAGSGWGPPTSGEDASLEPPKRWNEYRKRYLAPPSDSAEPGVGPAAGSFVKRNAAGTPTLAITTTAAAGVHSPCSSTYLHRYCFLRCGFSAGCADWPFRCHADEEDSSLWQSTPGRAAAGLGLMAAALLAFQLQPLDLAQEDAAAQSGSAARIQAATRAAPAAPSGPALKDTQAAASDGGGPGGASGTGARWPMFCKLISFSAGFRSVASAPCVASFRLARSFTDQPCSVAVKRDFP